MYTGALQHLTSYCSIKAFHFPDLPRTTDKHCYVWLTLIYLSTCMSTCFVWLFPVLYVEHGRTSEAMMMALSLGGVF